MRFSETLLVSLLHSYLSLRCDTDCSFYSAVALQTMQHVDLGNNALLTKITACHVTTYYHVGYAYMALGRYPDAIKIFVSVLIFFNRMKQYHTRSYQYGSVSRFKTGNNLGEEVRLIR
jgi:hypothetical protein